MIKLCKHIKNGSGNILIGLIYGEVLLDTQIDDAIETSAIEGEIICRQPNLHNCEDMIMEVHENIKFIRKFKSLSQEKMAEKLDMTLNGYAKIEQGKVDINLSRLKQISEIFGVKLEQLVGLNDKNVFNFIENFQPDSIFYQQSHHNAIDQTRCQHELEKANLIIEQKDKENAYLKEIIELVKKQG